ncbi:MAG: acetate--CoA ligase family protein [Thermodesulfobacteriota bacterium]
MLKKSSWNIIENSKSLGWVLEPDAKTLMKLQGFAVPDSILTNSFEKANQFMEDSSSPVVVKAVSKKIVHKTEQRAVVTNLTSSSHLKKEMARLQKLEGCENILVEQMVEGIELIIGAKNDFQFGPVVVFGIGGTSVEIYNDTAIRMAPLRENDVLSMVESLKAKAILFGHRGKPGVNMKILTRLIVDFSLLIMEFQDDMESIDLNPVICTKDQCIIADARIMLQKTTL